MTRLRSWLFARRWLALAVTLLALAVRIVVAPGMMPGQGAGGATLVVCSGQMGPMGMAHARPDPAKPVMPCAYTDLLAAALDTVALPVLPAMALPVVAAGPVVLASIAVRARRLRPPLRGPPALLAA